MPPQAPSLERRGPRNLATIFLWRQHLSQGAQQGILARATELGWRLLDAELTRRQLPNEYNVVGAISGLPLDHPDAQWMRRLPIPVVRVGRMPNPLDDRVPAVILDNVAIGRMAAEHLAERNFKHLGLLLHEEASEGELIWEGFQQCATELGTAAQRFTLPSATPGATPSERYDQRSSAMQSWLRDLPIPAGIFVAPPNLASRVLAICYAAGYAVPEDIALLASRNQVLDCETAPVPLSAIDLNGETRGREAVELLHAVVDGTTAAPNPVVVRPARVVERHSSHVLAVPDPVVARALRYAWDHLDHPLTVDQIAAEVGVCRRRLERGFRRHLQRGVAAELQRKRLERCAELLTSTTLTLAEIAPKIGFASGWQAVGSGVTTAANGNPGNALNVASGGDNYLVNSGSGFDATADISGSFDFYIVESGGFYDNGAFFFGDVQSALGSAAGDHLRVDLREKTFGARANILDADGTTLFDGSGNNLYEIATDTWYGAEFTWTAATGDFSFSWGTAEGPMTVSSYSLNSSEVFFGFGTKDDAARFDNISITGTAAGIPEPASLVLLGLAGTFAIRRRRR